MGEAESNNVAPFADMIANVLFATKARNYVLKDLDTVDLEALQNSELDNDTFMKATRFGLQANDSHLLTTARLLMNFVGFVRPVTVCRTKSVD